MEAWACSSLGVVAGVEPREGSQAVFNIFWGYFILGFWLLQSNPSYCSIAGSSLRLCSGSFLSSAH